MASKRTDIRCNNPALHSRGRPTFVCCVCKVLFCAFCQPFISNTENKRVLCDPCWQEREAQETGAALTPKDIEIRRLKERRDLALGWLELALKAGVWGSVEDAYSSLHPEGLCKRRSFTQCFNCPTPNHSKLPTCDECGKERRDVRAVGHDANGDPDAPSLCFFCRKKYERRPKRKHEPRPQKKQKRASYKSSNAAVRKQLAERRAALEAKGKR